MRLTVFASGSGGNCCLVRSGADSVIIDAGISARRISTSLTRAGLTAQRLAGILITHEHSDHIKGLSVFLKNTPVTVFAPGTVAAALRRLVPGAEPYIRAIPREEPVSLGCLTVEAFPTSHDVTESVGYRVTGPDGVFALATDTGCVTDAMLRYLPGADIALIEANHDEQMLRYGPYPVQLKRRILSDEGHLSNAECTWLAAVLARSGTRDLVLGHLSRENNVPGLALRTVGRALEGTDVRLWAAPELGFLEVETEPCSV